MSEYIAWEFEGIMVAGYYGCITDTDQEGEKAVENDVQLAIHALSTMITTKNRKRGDNRLICRR